MTESRYPEINLRVSFWLRGESPRGWFEVERCKGVFLSGAAGKMQRFLTSDEGWHSIEKKDFEKPGKSTFLLIFRAIFSTIIE